MRAACFAVWIMMAVVVVASVAVVVMVVVISALVAVVLVISVTVRVPLVVVIEVVVAVVVVVIVVTALVCAGVVIDTFAEVLTVAVLIIVSDATVDSLMYALCVNVKVFAGVVTAFGIIVPDPLDECGCWAAFDCRSMAGLDCAHFLQACMPSYHV